MSRKAAAGEPAGTGKERWACEKPAIVRCRSQRHCKTSLVRAATPFVTPRASYLLILRAVQNTRRGLRMTAQREISGGGSRAISCRRAPSSRLDPFEAQKLF